MRSLILMRHAKSDWAAAEETDHDRPLNKRGRLAAPLMAGWLAKERIVPALTLVSSARRAEETLALMRPLLPRDLKVLSLPSLYLALPQQILSTVAAQSDALKTILIIGHNPGLADLARWLAYDGAKDALRCLKEKFPTAAIAILDFDLPRWREIDGESGYLRAFVRPKDIPASQSREA